MKIKEGFVLRQMCGENIVAGEGLEHINFNKLISLNSTAAYLWQELTGKEFTIEEMAELLIGRYGIDKELALKDSEALAKAWADAGVAIL
ncbi:MAG: PqqD family protein [Bacteroidales bacterium]|nr:PqqD family protein [Bacteroidales bacterium]